MLMLMLIDNHYVLQDIVDLVREHMCDLLPTTCCNVSAPAYSLHES